MDELIRRLLDEMEAELSKSAQPGERLDLYHIGRSVLIFHYGANGFSTRDFDVVWMRNSVLEQTAAKLFGKESAKAAEIGIYLDLVPQGLPPLPQRFRAPAAARSLVPGRSFVSGSWNRMTMPPPS